MLLFAGCAHDRVLVTGSTYTVAKLSGDGQSAPAGSRLPVPLTVAVRDASGTPVKATIIVFRVTTGSADGAVLLDSLAVTDESGAASAQLQLGARAGAVEVMGFPIGAADRGVVFRATASSGPTISGVLPAVVAPGDTIAIAGALLGGTSSTVEFGSARVKPVSGSDGQLRVLVPDCQRAGAVNVRVLSGVAWTSPIAVTYAPRRRPLALRLYESALIGAGELSGCASLSADGGAEYVLIPQFAAHAAAPALTTVRISAGEATAAALFAATAREPAPPAPDPVQSELDVRLRAAERRLAQTAPGTGAYQPPAFTASVGSLRTFQVITTLSADQFTNATGRLRWVGEHLGIYVDTSTAQAFSETDLERLGRLFDTDLYRTATGAFGPESDIDHNGKVLVFLTPRVNALVAATDCGARGFVSGFFYGRDLLPSLPSSNAGEIFYAMVPDAYGHYSCSHAPYDVMRLASSTFVHEMQHMISFFHHVVARAGEPEEAWLNEGLSHIAEELVSRVFEARYPAPLGRSTASQLFPDSASPFISPQMLNSYVYLNNSALHSVTTFQASGSLEERGAAWLFLRWLGDQKGESIYRQLVQTSSTGIANVETRSGEPFARLFGDFTIAIWADSMPGVARDHVAPRYRFLSRNLRQLMAREAVLSGFDAAFPVPVVRVPVGGYAEGPMQPGTMVYLTLGPFSPGQGSVALSYSKPGGGVVGGSDGAQVGILRVK